jgi:hypothetical protein
MRPSPRGLLDTIVKGAARALGVRMDGGAAPVSQAPAGEGWRGIMDCGPGGGCGGPPVGIGGPAALAITPSLDRSQIDDVYTDLLMRRIVNLIVDHAMGVDPSLAGDAGEQSSTIGWLKAKGAWAEAKRAMIYSRQYGGGGVVSIVDDGRPADQEVDLAACRDVVGYYALPKWYLVPDGVGSGRVRAAWYGPRVGRPEHYFVTPVTGLGSGADLASLPPAEREATEAAHPDRMPRDLRRILNKCGNRFHRSRVIAWPFCDEMDMRLARWMPQWNGWGPGIVEAVLAPFLAYRGSALRTSAIMRSVVVNTMEVTNLEHRQTTPDLGAALRNALEWIRWCRDYTDDSVPLIAHDKGQKFNSLSHNVAGIDKLVATLRQFVLDEVEYPAVVLFGDSAGGLNGGERSGEWRAYASTVKAMQSEWVWTAGSFGGGLRQMVLMAQACTRGPTGGRMDPTVQATWPSILTESDDDRATRRLKNSQARAQDRLALGLTPAAIRRFDPTVKEDYPGLDVDEGPLPTIAAATPGEAAPRGSVPAVESQEGGAAAATTPAKANEVLAGEEEAAAEPTADAPKPVVLPPDVHTEAEIAAAMKMTRAAIRKVIEEAGVAPVMRAPPGTRGGHRYSLGQVMQAFQLQAMNRADAMRQSSSS